MGFRGRKSDQSEISIHKLFINNFFIFKSQKPRKPRTGGPNGPKMSGMAKNGKKMAKVRENMVNNCEPT